MHAVVQSRARRDRATSERVRQLSLRMEASLVDPDVDSDAGGCFLLVVRGTARVSCSLGAFTLDCGGWLAVPAGDAPAFEADAGALILSLFVDGTLKSRLREHPQKPIFFAGTGRIFRDRETPCLARVAQGDRTSVAARVGVLRCRAGGASNDWRHARIARHAGRAVPGIFHESATPVVPLMQQARLMLEGHQDRIIKISDLATDSGFSLWYFSKLFHSLYGVSPQRHALESRLSRACELLVRTPLSIADIGVACGFENPCSFARAFRGHLGETASAYRCRLRASSPACPRDVRGVNEGLPIPGCAQGRGDPKGRLRRSRRA